MYIQNPAIFRILAYLELEIYLELCQGIFLHIQNTVSITHMLRTLSYLELYRIQDFGIFQTKDIFRTLSNIYNGGDYWKGNYSSAKSILAVWSDKVLNTPLTQEVLSTLYSNLRLCTISGILRTLAYSKLCLCRHVQAHSIIIVIITLNFLFFMYILFIEI